ncbi:MAG: TonB-dependent receptor plug domain-containing protein [Chitinophagales bacterium]|nr:TonB-dependent receptor plug domain-containing protein [Chitinophagales bacterium]
MKKFFILIGLVTSITFVHAQSGEISGRIVDDLGDGVPFANVAIVEDGVPTGYGTSTDFDGNYSLKPLNPGKYDVMFTYIGFNTRIEKGVVVSSDKTTYVDVELAPTVQEIDVVEIVEYRVPLIDPGQTSTQQTVSAEEIDALPTRNVQSIASSTAGVYQADEGEAVNIRGSRANATEYYVDGIKVRGTTAIPQNSIEQITVVTGGVPARYGDATGGIINVTTKGPSKDWRGGLEVITSQFLDPYNYNLVSGDLTGPIWKDKNTGRPKLGVFLSAEYSRVEDSDPSAIGVWRANSDVLSMLEETPLRWNDTRSGFLLNAETITRDDIHIEKAKPNAVEHQGSAAVKFNLRLNDNMNLVVGGNAVYRSFHDWVKGYELLNSVNNNIETKQTYRGFARFTHNLGRKVYEGDEDVASSAIQNAYYTIQVDYEKFLNEEGDDVHKENVFDYGYIGQFNTTIVPSYDNLDPDDNTYTSPDGSQTFNIGFIQNGFSEQYVEFIPGTQNPLGTNYTTTYYDLVGTDISPGFNENIRQIQQNNALINGERSGRPFDIWYNTGRQFNGYTLEDRDQFNVRLEGAFDILKPGSSTRNKHSIEFGVSFEQRIDRYWSINPLDLWERMRQLSNNHIGNLDEDNPTFIIDGQEYTYAEYLSSGVTFGNTDTILLNRRYDAENQSTFDRRLRQRLGLATNGLDFIQVDALDPSVFSLDLFTPDELFGDGDQFVFYYGYDYTGNKLSTQPSFNEFFTKKDEEGNFERGIPAFRPIYTAAWLEDKFTFKDLTFRVGVRVDRYDANQKVLKDPFSLYEVRTAAEVSASHPSTIGDDFAVYVDDYQSNNPGIVGYRDGDQWYDSEGNAIANATVIQNAGAGGVIQPYLVNTNFDENTIKATDGTYDPNSTFKDYEPQVTVMPRLQFSFNLTDKALFFAHYDILAQRPPERFSGRGSRLIATPDNWLFFSDIVTSRFFPNPSLKPEKTINFQIGFRQRVSNTSAIGISAFYREFKDMLQVTQINFAFPRRYNTFGNVDFGAAKGFSIEYDLRRTGNVRMTANYSIQFAEGTGSDDRSQLNLINANQPNLRSVAPLGFDARHTINVSFDYRYGSGSEYNGPVIGNSQILSDAGINFTFNGRSGTPYTKQSNATPEGFLSVPTRPITQGRINGARLPWNFRVNGKINKRFNFNVGNKEGESGRNLSMNVYVQVQNLFNTQNVLNVYRFTGNPDDDGYLTDPVGIQQIESFDDARKQSFIDLYQAFINNPNYYSQARTIRLGLQLGF